MKVYDYVSIIIDDRGHLDDPEFLDALNYWGSRGYKRSEEQAKGAKQLVILFERERIIEDSGADGR